MASKALLLLCLLAVGASAVSAKTLTLLLVYKNGDRVSTPGYSNNATTYRTWTGDILDFKTLKPLGYVNGLTTVVKVRPTYKVFLTSFTYDFGTSQITTFGNTVTNKPAAIAITGGTGMYKSASGTALATESTPAKVKGSVAETKVVLTI